MRAWSDVVPDDVVKLKVAWDRRHALRRAAATGVSRSELARILGVSAHRAIDLVAKAEREVRDNKRDPVEKYLAGMEHTTHMFKSVRAQMSRPGVLERLIDDLVDGQTEDVMHQCATW